MSGSREQAFTRPKRASFEEPLMTGSCLQTGPGPPEATWQDWGPLVCSCPEDQRRCPEEGPQGRALQDEEEFAGWREQ